MVHMLASKIEINLCNTEINWQERRPVKTKEGNAIEVS